MMESAVRTLMPKSMRYRTNIYHSYVTIIVKASDVVETVTSETWLKLRDRDFAIKAETATWKFETATRNLTFI